MEGDTVKIKDKLTYLWKLVNGLEKYLGIDKQQLREQQPYLIDDIEDSIDDIHERLSRIDIQIKKLASINWNQSPI